MRPAVQEVYLGDTLISHLAGVSHEHALNDDPVTTYQVGDTFYEPSGCVHRVTRNPSARAKTRLLAVILHPRDTEKVTVPEEAAKND